MQAWCPMPAVGPASGGVPVSLPAVLLSSVSSAIGLATAEGPAKEEGPAKVEAGRKGGVTRNLHLVSLVFTSFHLVSPVFTSWPWGGPCHAPNNFSRAIRAHSHQFEDSSHFAFCILHSAFLPPLHHSNNESIRLSRRLAS
jgi:hypothetical protein